MSFSFEIKGVELSMSEMAEINRYYEAASTAEYIMSKYKIADENEALFYAYDVRHLMLEEGYREDEAVESVLKENDAFETEVKILFQAVGDKNNLASVKENFGSEPLLFDYFNEGYVKESVHKLEHGELSGEFEILWLGKIDRDCLTDELVNDLVRLTHHAECFYEDTGAEYVHVEVCIDGKWYGRDEKEQTVDTLISEASQRSEEQGVESSRTDVVKEF